MPRKNIYKKILYLAVIFFVIAIIFKLKADHYVTPASQNQASIQVARQTPLVQINEVNIPVELATTSAAVQKGLSGRLSLDSDKGMLFVFSRPAIYRFWMPDMHFPLDIIWIKNGIIVDISQNIPNIFDPKNPKFYTPSSPAQYVLEINADFSKNKGIKIGDSVIFKNIDLLNK